MGTLIVGVLSLVVFGALAVEAFLAVQALAKGSAQARAATPYTQPGAGAGLIVVVGDSTGYGTGASDPHASIAGRVGSLFPAYTIKNLSSNGLTTKRLAEMFPTMLPEESIDVLLIQIGGNDVLFFSSPQKTRIHLDTILAHAKERARNVVVMTHGNVGAAPAFGPMLSSVYAARTRMFQKLFMERAGLYQVPYIDLYEPPDVDLFAKDPKRYHAPDGIHPGSAGYALWFEKLRPVLTQIVK